MTIAWHVVGYCRLLYVGTVLTKNLKFLGFMVV